MIEKFKNIYEYSIWGDDKNSIYNGSSGGGSEFNYNINEYVPFIRNFITTNNIQIIGDLGCGSCNNLISLYSDLNIIYFGYDAYDKIIIYNQLKQLQPMYKYNFFFLVFIVI